MNVIEIMDRVDRIIENASCDETIPPGGFHKYSMIRVRREFSDEPVEQPVAEQYAESSLQQLGYRG
jgi:hypothetical protein